MASRSTGQRLAWMAAVASAFLALGTVYLRARGVSVELAVSYVAQAATGPMFVIVGGIILGRRPRHRMGWFCLALGLASAVDEFLRGFFPTQPLPSDEPWMVAAVLVSDALGNAVFAGATIFLPLLFPDGRIPGPRWRWVLRGAIALAAMSVVTNLAAVGPLAIWDGERELIVANHNPLGAQPFGLDLELVDDVIGPFALVFFAAGIVATVVRYRRDPITRRQIKWVAFAMITAIAGVILTAVPALQVAGDILASLAFASVPVAIGIAITRYRLFEIDRILSRTVGYLLMTGVLVGVYLGSVLALGAVARSLTTAGDDLVVAISTLLVAALFQPLRRRVQGLVDRRFNRARYDAQRTVAAFGGRLRDQVDLRVLEAELRTTAAAALHPSTAGVWVRSRP